MATVALFRGTSGINNAVPATRLKSDKGFVELAAGVNVDIGDNYELMRRKKETQQRAEAGHSPFCDGGDAFYVSAGSLYRLNSDFSRDLVRSSVGDEPMWYAQVAGMTFYGNGVASGIVEDGSSRAWSGTYYGPETERSLAGPPTGAKPLAYVAGCLIAVVDNIVWKSEPYAPSLFDLAAGAIPLPSRILGGVGLDTSFYVSDETGVYFITLAEPTFRKVHNKPMREGTALRVFDYSIGDRSSDGVLMLCADGIFFGSTQGEFINLSKQRLVLPDGGPGYAVLTNKHYIVAMGD